MILAPSSRSCWYIRSRCTYDCSRAHYYLGRPLHHSFVTRANNGPAGSTSHTHTHTHTHTCIQRALVPIRIIRAFRWIVVTRVSSHVPYVYICILYVRGTNLLCYRHPFTLFPTNNERAHNTHLDYVRHRKKDTFQ
jgi:hypothetical protein